MRNLPLSKVYQLLEPGPVVLLTTAHKGRANVMAMSWHMMVEFTPPLVACIVSNADYSFAALRSTKECVIALPSRELARTVVGIGNCSGRDVDKFEKFSLTATPAKQVAAPLIAECFANLECKVVNTRLVNEYNLFVLEVVKAWVDARRRTPRPFTITAMANSSSMEGRSRCNPKSLDFAFELFHRLRAVGAGNLPGYGSARICTLITSAGMRSLKIATGEAPFASEVARLGDSGLF